MSRIGKKIIDIPDGVNVTINESEILTTGPKGELSCENFSGTKVVQENNQITQFGQQLKEQNLKINPNQFQTYFQTNNH